MPKLRGTAMSLASFNMVVGGAIGTSVNGRIINASSIGTIFLIAAVAMFLVAFLASTIVKK
jgi:predicted MFS family arabinose efflux permease